MKKLLKKILEQSIKIWDEQDSYYKKYHPHKDPMYEGFCNITFRMCNEAKGITFEERDKFLNFLAKDMETPIEDFPKTDIWRKDAGGKAARLLWIKTKIKNL